MSSDDPNNDKIARLNHRRLVARDIDQLLGICELSIQHGTLEQDQAEAILVWLRNHRRSLNTWPISVLYDRLEEALADGVLDSDEQKDVLGLIASISRPVDADEQSFSATLPINQDIDRVVIPGHSFCFTGVFDFGSRSECQQATAACGGEVEPRVSLRLDYLVIGSVGSGSWKHASFGNKILRAVDLRQQTGRLKIVSEAHWLTAIHDVGYPI